MTEQASAPTPRAVGLLAFVLLASSVVFPTLLGLLAVDLTAGLSFGDRELGLAVSCFWLVTAVAAPVCGRWADRLGWSTGAIVGATIVGCCLLACVLLVQSWPGLLLVLATAGLGYAWCSPTSNLLVVTMVGRGRQASVLGFKQTAPPVMTAAAGVTLPAIAHLHGWRPAMAIGLVLPLGVLLGVWSMTRRAKLPPVTPGLGPRRPAPPAEPAVPLVELDAPPLRPVPMVVAAGLGTLSVATVTGFAVLTLVGVGVEPVVAAAVISGGSVLAVAARVLAGAHLDARPVGDLRPLMWLMAVATASLAMASVGILGSARAPGWWWTGLVVVGVVLSLVAAWTWPALLLLAVVRRARGAGAASGLLQLGSGIGSAVGPLGFGLLSEAGGRGWAWLLMAASTATAVVLVRVAARGVALEGTAASSATSTGAASDV